MIVEKSDNSTRIIPESKSVKEFYDIFNEAYSNFKGEHLIIDFSDKINIKLEELLLFLNISKEQKSSELSFVLVVKDINIDDVPDEINVVPTLLEANDVLEMEAIERDLGF